MTDGLDIPEAESRSGTATALLHRIREQLRAEHVTLGEVLEHLGERAPGFLLVALSIPAIVPTPGVPAGFVFGTVLALVSLQMIAGQQRLYVPGWLSRRRVRSGVVQAMVSRAAPVLERIERRLAPRYVAFSQPNMLRPLGLLVLLMGVLIALPIPFGNTVPGIAVLVIALGLVVRDGLAVAVGVALSLVAVAVSAGLVAAGYWMVAKAVV